MKSLDKYIIEHLKIDYRHQSIKNELLFEKNGVYDGCYELSKYINDYIQKYYVKGDIEQFEFHKKDLNFPNIFFETLIIDIDTTSDDGGEYEDNEELNSEKLFDEVYINIYLKNISDLTDILMHELTHAFNNWNMLKKKNRNYLNMGESSLYDKLNPKLSKNEIDHKIKSIIYFTLGYEQNAFFAQIKAELQKYKSKIKNPNDALSILKQTSIYTVYERIYDYINNEEFNDLKINNQIVKTYNDLYETNYDFDKIIKILKRKVTKSFNKLQSNIGKLCCENLNNSIYTKDFFSLYLHS